MYQRTSINVDYVLSQAAVIPHTLTIKLISGYLFPSSEQISYITIDYGDNRTETIYADNKSKLITGTVLSDIPNFFPSWKNSVLDNAMCVVPMVETQHTYLKSGEYVIKTVLVSTSGLKYIGQDYSITVESDEYVNIYDTFADIDAAYELTINNEYNLDIIGIDQNGFTPYVRAYINSVTTDLPFIVSAWVEGIEGRTDIDYVLWEFGDGTTILKDNTEPFIYSYYKLPSTGISITVTATIYMTRGAGFKYKFTATDSNNFNSTAGIGESVSFTEEGKLRSFTMFPTYSYTLPVEAVFYHEITSNLQYIISNYGDGSYDVTPVAYDFLTSNEVQIQTVYHTYNTVNTYRFNPKCIYVYKSSTGKIYYNQSALKSNLFYDLGIVNPSANFLLTPITSSINFRKFNNISTLITYPSSVDTGLADINVRLDVGLEHTNILSFDKIVWMFDGDDYKFEIIQDKNTSKAFGTLPTITLGIPVTQFTITADLYRSHIDDLIDPSATLTLYNKYSTDPFDILSLSANIASNIEIEQTYIPSFDIGINSILPDLTTFVGLASAGQAITPEIELLEYNTAFSSGELLYQSKIVDFDLLFTAINPAANFLNRDNPTTATTETGFYASKFDIGFFKPSKTAIVIVDPGIFTFTIDADNINFFEPTYLPNPYLYGSETSGCIFKVNNNSFSRDISLGLAAFEPITNKDCVAFNGYNSNNALQQTTDLTELTFLTTPGALSDRKRDIYGNTFSLIDINSNFTSNVVIGTNTDPYNLVDVSALIKLNTVRDSDKLTTYTAQTTASQNIFTRNGQAKSLTVTNLANDTYSIATALNYGSIKYPSTVWAQLTSNLIYSCDIMYDVFFIETSNYIIIDKIKAINNQFVNPHTSNLIITKESDVTTTTNKFIQFSNRYKKDNYVYFAKLSSIGSSLPLNSNNLAVFPIIYRFDYTAFSVMQIYPLASDQPLNTFSFDNTTVQYVEASSPKITYFSKTNTFNISYILKDLNKSPYIVSANFQDKDTVIFTGTYGVKLAAYNYSNTFTSNDSIASYTWLLTASAPIVISNALTL